MTIESEVFMKAVVLTVLTFIGVFFVAALIRGATKDIAGPGAISLIVSLGTVGALFYFPHRVYKANKANRERQE